MSKSRVILLAVGLNTIITVGAVVLGYVYLAPAAVSGSMAQSVAEEEPRKVSDFTFYPVEKIVVNLPGEKREHYFVIDLALQAEAKVPASTFKNIEPLVRSSVIALLSPLKFAELRRLGVADVQKRIQEQLKEDFESKGLGVPFTNVLVSKLLVQ